MKAQKPHKFVLFKFFKWIDFNSNLSCAAKLVSPEKQIQVNMQSSPHQLPCPHFPRA